MRFKLLENTPLSGLAFITLSVGITMAGLGLGCHDSSSRVFANQPEPAFDIDSLQGSYSSVGRAGAGTSVSIGAATFDGFGGVTRFVRINTAGENGERVLIDLTSQGTYTIDEEGTGVIQFTNSFPDGSTTEVTFDLVVRKSSPTAGAPLAEEVFAIQREAGVTASLVEESFTRQRPATSGNGFGG